MEYVDFLGDVLLFRTCRDTDDFPEIWMDRRLDGIILDKDLDPDVRRRLLLTAKIAELIDGRKQWLIDEIEQDLHQAYFPGQWYVRCELPDPGPGNVSLLRERAPSDDAGQRIHIAGHGDSEPLLISGSIKADDMDAAETILQERVKAFLDQLDSQEQVAA